MFPGGAGLAEAGVCAVAVMVAGGRSSLGMV